MLTEQDIVDRANRESVRSFRAPILILILLSTLGWPVPSAWIHVHRELMLGILIGSTTELLIILASRWLWDRYLWLRWFSHQ